MSVACGPAAPSVAPASPSVDPASPSVDPVSPSVDPVSPSADGLPPTGSPSTSVAVDRTLLDVLPDAVDGVSLGFSEEASDEVARGEAPPGVAALAYAIGVAGQDLVVASVVRLRSGVFGEAFYRDWRDSYTAGVCEQAGGVLPGVAEAEIGGRNVFVGSCVNGGHTYYVWLPAREAIVSAYSVGERNLGERLMESIEE